MTTAGLQPVAATRCGFRYTTGAVEWVCVHPPHGEPEFNEAGQPVGHGFVSRRRPEPSTSDS